MHSVFIKYMYTCPKPFPYFLNLSEVNNLWRHFYRGRGGRGVEMVKSVMKSLTDSFSGELRK